MRAAGKPALSPTQVRDFVDRFMPAYQTYLGSLYATAAGGGSSESLQCEQLLIEIDAHRQLVHRVVSK